MSGYQNTVNHMNIITQSIIITYIENKDIHTTMFSHTNYFLIPKDVCFASQCTCSFQPPKESLIHRQVCGYGGPFEGSVAHSSDFL